MPTMQDVAQAAGCDVSTVSLSLRNDPRITPATKARVRLSAERLGYRINPLVAAWVSARRSAQPRQQHVSVGYLTCLPSAYDWKGDEHFRSIFEGMVERAAGFGFVVTEFRVSDYERDLRRLDRVLWTRNVQGLVVGPTLQHHELTGLDWDRFALVTIGYGLILPVVHRVTEDHHLGMKIAFEAAMARGHRRIGLVMTRQHHAARRERWVSAYLFEQWDRLEPKERLAPLVKCGADRAEVDRWLRVERPEIVLADEPARWQGMVPVLGFAISTADPVSGVHENNREIGRHAADLLVSLVLRNERGIPQVRQTVLVEPVFATG